MPISDFITSTIVTQSPPLGLPSLLIPLVAAVLETDQNTAWTAEYGASVDVISLAPDTYGPALLALGITAGDDIYEALTDMHSQRINGQQSAPSEFLLARRATPVAMVRTAVVNAATAGNFILTINGTDFTQALSVDEPGTATAIRALVNAGDEPVTASGAGANVVLTADVAGIPFTSSATHSTTPASFTITTTTPNTGIDTDIAAWRVEDDRWTLFLETTRSTPVITTAASTLEALSRPRLAVFQTDDSLAQDGASTADLASELGSAGLGLTGALVIWHPDDDEFVDFGIVGKICGAGLPGDVGWVHQSVASVNGVSAPTLTSTDNLITKHYSFLEEYTAPVPPTSSFRGGRMLDGSPVDIYQLVQDLNLRIQIRGYQALRNTNTPYNGGEPTAEAAVRGALGERTGPAGEAALVEGSITVTVPASTDQEDADALARIFRGITWGALAQGKLEAMDITGSLEQ